MAFEETLLSFAHELRAEETPSPRLLRQVLDVPSEHPQQTGRRPSLWLWLGPAFAIASMALFINLPTQLFHRSSTQPPNPVKNHLIKKGMTLQIHLEFARKRKGKWKRYKARPNQALYPGDLFQFVYSAGKDRDKIPRHIAILSLEETGETFALITQKGHKSIQLPKRQGRLPKYKSMKFHGKKGKALFLAFASHKPFSVRALQDEVHRAFLRSKKDLQNLQQIDGPWMLVWRQSIRQFDP